MFTYQHFLLLCQHTYKIMISSSYPKLKQARLSMSALSSAFSCTLFRRAGFIFILSAHKCGQNADKKIDMKVPKSAKIFYLQLF